MTEGEKIKNKKLIKNDGYRVTISSIAVVANGSY
jgi:hypothetical protein